MSDKRAIIFGSSGGIGQAIAHAYAKSSFNLVLHYNLNETACLQIANAHPNIHCDILKIDFSEIGCEHAHIFQNLSSPFDVVVHAAGIVPKKPAQGLSSTDLAACALINFVSPVALTNNLYNRGLINNSGAVIYIGSIHAHNTCENFTAYAGTKAALMAAAKVQAVEWMNAGITVNTVAPGPTVVERNRHSLLSTETRWLDHIPARRFAEPIDIAHAVMLLTESRASYITGQELVVDGGMTSRANFPNREK